ncbi:MAG TPA: putative metal-binding motif-containing protein [Polyangiales bacterium]|nr:putative metal-binding motif-containing protein [Polyangiales bacterium]
MKVWVAVLSLLLASCTLIDLSGKIDQASCTYDAECMVLNDGSNPNFDPCKWFACGSAGKCVQGPPDLDRDGYVSSICESDPKRQDCDDLDPTRHPHATEICDDRDNDCDTLVDEGVLNASASDVFSFSAAPASDLAFALDVPETQLSVGAILDSSPPTAIARSLAYEESAMQPATLFTLGDGATVDGLGVVSLPVDFSGLAFYLREPAPARVMAGQVDDDQHVFSIDPSVATSGVACAADESCADAMAADRTTPNTDPPSLSSGGDGILVAYARDPDPSSDLCSTPDAIVQKRLLGNLLARTPQGLSQSGSAFDLGMSAEGGAPALLALPSQTSSGIAYGWLIAYPANDGSLLISHLTFDKHQPNLSDPLLRIKSDDGPLHTPQLSSTPMIQHDQMPISVAAERGCGDDSRIVFQLYTLTLHSDASITMRSKSDMVELGGDLAQHSFSVAHRDDSPRPGGDRRGWALAFRDASGLRARLLSEAGVPTGDEPYTLAPAADGGSPASATAIAPLHDGGDWFGVYTYAEDGDPVARTLRRIALGGCQGR